MPARLPSPALAQQRLAYPLELLDGTAPKYQEQVAHRHIPALGMSKTLLLEPGCQGFQFRLSRHSCRVVRVVVENMSRA